MSYDETTNPFSGIEARPGSGHFGVYDYGAHMWAYQPDGQQPVLWMSEFSDFVDGKPIRGGIPVIFPWFATGPAGDKAPAHGPARVTAWRRADIKDTLDRDGRLIVEYILDHGILGADAGVEGSYYATLRAKFTPEYVQITTHLTNTGDEDLTFECAFHTYLTVGDIRQLSIDGLDGCDYLDRAAGAPKLECVQEGPVTFSGETDRIYMSSGEVVLNDPVMNRKLIVSKTGSMNTVVWNPWIAKSAAMPDFGDDEWTGMVCIEAANVLDNAVTLRPGETHEMRQRVTLG